METKLPKKVFFKYLAGFNFLLKIKFNILIKSCIIKIYLFIKLNMFFIILYNVKYYEAY